MVRPRGARRPGLAARASNMARSRARAHARRAAGNESISWDEFRKFWQNVIGSGYPAEDISEEVDMMLAGGSWVDFNDGRTT